jgi:prophage maintenance system killer protein
VIFLDVGMNGRRLTLTNDEAYRLVSSVATGELDDVNAIAAVLESGSGRPETESTVQPVQRRHNSPVSAWHRRDV